MDAAIAANRRRSNLLEGMALAATLQALPVTAGAALFGRLCLDLGIFGHRDNEILYVTSLFLGMLLLHMMPFLAPKSRFKTALYEPLFFDASLSLSDKFARWRAKPSTSQSLLTMLLMLSVLAVAVVTVG